MHLQKMMPNYTIKFFLNPTGALLEICGRKIRTEGMSDTYTATKS